MKYLNKIINKTNNKIIRNKLLKYITFRRFNILLILSLTIVVVIKAKYNKCSDLYSYLFIGFMAYCVFITYQSIKKRTDILINFLTNIISILFLFTVFFISDSICINSILILKMMIFPIFSSIMTLIFQYLSYERYRKNIELIGFYSFPLKNISILDVVFSVIYGLWIILWITVIAKL